VVHVLQRVQVDPEGLGDRGQIESELHQQVDKVHLVTGERVADLRAGQVTLGPRAGVETTVTAEVGVLLDVVDVMNVEHHRPTTSSFCRHVQICHIIINIIYLIKTQLIKT